MTSKTSAWLAHHLGRDVELACIFRINATKGGLGGVVFQTTPRASVFRTRISRSRAKRRATGFALRNAGRASPISPSTEDGPDQACGSREASAAGSVASTAPDLHSLFTAMFGERVVSADILTEMIGNPRDAVVLVSGNESGYVLEITYAPTAECLTDTPSS